MLGVILGVVDFDYDVAEGGGDVCVDRLREHVQGYIVILSVCFLVEGIISIVSMRGSILYTEPRTSMQYLLYIRLGKLELCLWYDKQVIILYISRPCKL